MAAPTITSITPGSGPPGTMVTVLGSGLSTVVGVKVGTTAATFTKVSDSQLNFTVPAGLAAGVDNLTLVYHATETDPGAFTVTTGVPAPPTGLSATLAGTPTAPTVVLGWTLSSGATSYDVYRNGALLATGVLMGTYTDPTPPLNANDTYTVSAVNTSGQSAQSAPATVGVGSGVPAVPTGLVASGITQSGFNLDWNASAGATGYTPYKNGVALATVTTNHIAVSGLNPSETDSWTVDAFDAHGHSAQSAAISVTTLPIGVPAPPTGLTAVLGGTPTSPSVVLNWTDSAGATSYDVYRNGVLIASGVPG